MPNSAKRINWISAILFIIVGLLCNEAILVSLFSYDDHISRIDILVFIRVLQALFILSGFVLLLLRNSATLAKKLSAVWLILISISIGLTLSELAVRVIRPTPGGFPKGDLLFEPDSVLGWRFVHNITTTVVWGNETEALIQINQDGFREKDLPQNTDIWVIGDSFVSALEVEEAKRFTEQIEEATNTRFYNFGVNGYGPVQYALLLKQELLKAHPKHLLVVLYIRNDLYDASGINDWSHGLKRPFIQNDSIVYPKNTLDEETILNQKRYLNRTKFRLEHLHLFNLIKLAFRDNANNTYQPVELDLAKIPQTEQIKRSLEATKKAVSLIQEIAINSSIDLTFVIAPSFLQVYPEKWSLYLKENDLSEVDFDLYLVNQQLQEFFISRNIRFIDLTEILKTAASKGSNSLYFEQNQHWTPEGHKRVATELVKQLGFIK
ncbi:hypothetical protein EP331_09525 [bacterium]|nr:MAG: hypothetical protein EP331_09525 [bacterium]